MEDFIELNLSEGGLRLFEWNNLCGCKALCTLLETTKTLEILNISSNEFNNDELIILCKSLCINKTLRTLDIGWNYLVINGWSRSKTH